VNLDMVAQHRTIDNIDKLKHDIHYADANYAVVDEQIPAFKHKLGDAGYDMYATEDKWIFPFVPRKVPVNFKAEIPHFHFGLMTSRSGESLKGNVVVPGIIDFNYRGQMAAIMFRISLLPRKLKKGTRIAQLIIIPYKEIAWFKKDKLSDSNRGEDGFGKSGIE